MGSPMRTLGFRTHVLLAIAGAIGVIYSLNRPWYASAPPPPKEDEAGIGDIHGPLNAVRRRHQALGVGQHRDTGWNALDHWGQMIAAMAIVAVVGALICFAPRLQVLGRDLARYGALAALAIIAWKLVDPPGSNERWSCASARCWPACSRSCSSPARPPSPTRRCAARSQRPATSRRPRRRPTSPGAGSPAGRRPA